ncbi:MAG TPA: CatA-like O-acetyltransferase [Pyrinomonadaceae bacterium]|jgi:chloramphenicol O-acetyltransferase type A
MHHYLDLDSWPRRSLFEFYRNFDKPYFNVCTRLDVTNLLAALSSRKGISVTLTYHYFALRTANEIEPFRYRLRQGRVVVHDVVHGGTTILLPDESFGLAYFEYERDFAKFHEAASRAVTQALEADGGLKLEDTDDDRLHFTTLPWVSFTSFSHARNWRREESATKIAFGKFAEENGRTWLPISVEVHHALMDGLHVGRFLSQMQEALLKPEACLGFKASSQA